MKKRKWSRQMAILVARWHAADGAWDSGAAGFECSSGCGFSLGYWLGQQLSGECACRLSV